MKASNGRFAVLVRGIGADCLMSADGKVYEVRTPGGGATHLNVHLVNRGGWALPDVAAWAVRACVAQERFASLP